MALRATASLARLRRDQGCHAEARDLLAPVYGWFTEASTRPTCRRKGLLEVLDAQPTTLLTLTTLLAMKVRIWHEAAGQPVLRRFGNRVRSSRLASWTALPPGRDAL